MSDERIKRIVMLIYDYWKKGASISIERISDEVPLYYIYIFTREKTIVEKIDLSGYDPKSFMWTILEEIKLHLIGLLTGSGWNTIEFFIDSYSPSTSRITYYSLRVKARKHGILVDLNIVFARTRSIISEELYIFSPDEVRVEIKLPEFLAIS